MVATKLSEVAGKGWGWYAASSPNEKKETIETNTERSSMSSLNSAVNSAYSGISNAYSFLRVPSLTSPKTMSNDGNNRSSSPSSSPAGTIEEDGMSASSTTMSGLSRSSNNGRRRRGSILSPSLLKIMHNPYIGVRGGGRIHQAKPPHESMDAVRKLLHVVDHEKKMGRSSVAQQHQLTGGERGLPPQRRPLSHSVHFDNNNDNDNDNNNNDISHEDTAATTPLPPLTPSRAPNQAETETTPIKSTSSNNSIMETPRHRNTAVDNSLALNTNNDKTRDRQEVPVKSYLPQHLATIDSMSLQSSPPARIEPESDPNQSHGNNIGDEKPSSSSLCHSPEETASQLAEGTLRAMRDLVLDEALELHASLKYWSDRWERPVFSWFVAGPLVWFGWIRSTQHCSQSLPTTFGGGYDHTVMVGQRVSQIQSVLARRLSAIGELQHHLLRAGWQRGVAHWGFLGEGGNWATVDGTDGRMMDEDSSQHSLDDHSDDDNDSEHDSGHEEEYYDEHDGSEHFFAEGPDHNSDIRPPDLHHHPQQNHSQRNHRYRLLRREFSEASVGTIGLHIDVPPPTPVSLSTPGSKMISGSRQLSQHDDRRNRGSLYYTNLHVRKRGRIQKDDQALCEWSIDALALIRSQLIRASNGKIPLSHSENWPFEQATGTSASIAEELSKSHQNGLPAWAGIKCISSNTRTTRTRIESRASCFSITEHADPSALANGGGTTHRGVGAGDTEFPKIEAECFDNYSLGGEDEPQFRSLPSSKRRSPSQKSFSSVKERAIVGIANLPLMTSEVSGLLDVMEDIMDIQRARRLEKLKQPPWWRQNWFLVALGPPSLAYLLYNNLIGRGQTWNLVKYATEKMLDFAREHVVLPCVALYDEFTKGPESISDHAARDTAVEILKKMIRSWLDETYPEMLETEKVRMSDTMDISLVEEIKEQSMKSVYNMNSVIRMSFIEAQFIKKEMMNALVALDEMQASTNFNMNLAAITPFVLLIWTINKISRFIFYTTFKWGKSRIETYLSFLDALTEIERLLIMRSDPPLPPTILRHYSNQASAHHHNHHRELHHKAVSSECVLESDDLGMLMLHIHELRTILWQERRRFSPNALRSVSEDLAELSGERGAVSVRQQLLIVERMNRAYSFLKRGAID